MAEKLSVHQITSFLMTDLTDFFLYNLKLSIHVFTRFLPKTQTDTNVKLYVLKQCCVWSQTFQQGEHTSFEMYISCFASQCFFSYFCSTVEYFFSSLSLFFLLSDQGMCIEFGKYTVGVVAVWHVLLLVLLFFYFLFFLLLALRFPIVVGWGTSLCAILTECYQELAQLPWNWYEIWCAHKIF